MSIYTDLAVALETNTLTLFLGTGFSKYLTDGKALSWIDLLVECSRQIENSGKLLNDLFNFNGKLYSPKLDILMVAQILEIEYKKRTRISVLQFHH